MPEKSPDAEATSAAKVPPSPEEVRAALESLLASASFTSASRSSRFLQYVVDETLEGRKESIKETVLGAEVFDRVRDFDPRIDAIVRVEATKLRTRMTAYYAEEGNTSSVLIEIPKGSYVPKFSYRSPSVSIESTESGASPARVKGKTGSLFAFGGLLALVVLLGSVGINYLRSKAPPVVQANLNSMAVLPFINLSSDKENEYFSDGLTEQLTDVLARSGTVRVSARTSAFAFKGKAQDITDIGKQLRVDSVLEGSVRKSGERLRITAQLIRVSDGNHIWSQTFDRPSNDIFAVQDDISQAILLALRSNLSRPSNLKRRLPDTENTEAFDNYLRGKSDANRWRLESALKYFQEAVRLDPNYALAHVEIAGVYLKMAIAETQPPAENMRLARASATRALEINPDLSEAHAALGTIIARYEWNWDVAEQHFRTAIALNPNDSIAHFSYADDVLLPQKRFDEALEHCRAGRQIDPLSTIGAMCIPWVTIYSGDSKTAVAEFDEILAVDPDNFMARGARGFAYMRGENYLKAIEDFEAVRPYSPMPAIPFLTYSYGRSGQTAKAAALEQLVMARARTNYVSPMLLAIVHLGVGKKSLTMDELEQGVEQHSYNAMFLGTESALDSLRGEPRFKALLLKMHLK